MKISYNNSPVSHIIIKNIFPQKINKKIIKEAIKLEKKFENAVIGNNTRDTTIRSNQVCYYHTVYPLLDDPINKFKLRQSSPLLFAFLKLYQNNEFRQLLSSSPTPLSEFVFTNTDEVQVSRYGNKSEKYGWHIDRFENIQRHITLVYYFNKEPKKYSGGELLLSGNPIYNHEIIGDKTFKTITPENNMLVIFPANVAHCVKETKSSTKFEDGRFSANIWLGFNR